MYGFVKNNFSRIPALFAPILKEKVLSFSSGIGV